MWAGVVSGRACGGTMVALTTINDGISYINYVDLFKGDIVWWWLVRFEI